MLGKAQPGGRPAVELSKRRPTYPQLWKYTCTAAGWSRHWRHLNMSVVKHT